MLCVSDWHCGGPGDRAQWAVLPWGMFRLCGGLCCSSGCVLQDVLFQGCGKNLGEKVTFEDKDGKILCFDCHMKMTNNHKIE